MESHVRIQILGFYVQRLSHYRSLFYLLLLTFLFTTNAGSFRFFGDAADPLLFFPGLGFDSTISFFLFSLLGLLSAIPLTWPPDFVLGLCGCDTCLALTGFLGDSKLEVPLSGVGSSSGRVSNSEPSLLIARAFRGLGDGLVTEDNFSADTKGERFSRLFEGDGAFFA